jgi:hypothetical protein
MPGKLGNVVQVYKHDIVVCNKLNFMGLITSPCRRAGVVLAANGMLLLWATYGCIRLVQ